MELRVERIDSAVDAEAAFVALYGRSQHAFWLDSSRPGADARFSFIGDDGGSRGKTIVHRVGDGVSAFELLAAELQRLGPVSMPELPFDFHCGFAGWLGYELKAECGGEAAHESSLPDAAFVLAARMLAFDHLAGHTYLLCLADGPDDAEAAEWLAATAAALRSLPLASSPPIGREARQAEGEPVFARSRERYLEQIEQCKRLLAEGETYEVCLTNTARVDLDAGDGPDPLELYRRLRRVNPAPFASYVRCGGAAVLSSSPERFLRIGRDRWVEAKPIKGTSRRGATPAEDVGLAERLRGDEKNRAENLMIADLMRNDLGSVCEVGTVHVPALMQVESYETVHQLVTTVRGLLRPDLGPLDCVRACFPPGSMTGAPKLRTMRILDRLEGEARGPYAGAIGYLGLGGGCDLSVAIRTIVCAGGEARVGAGGAIVALSDPEEEYEEMLLKARAVLRALPVSESAAVDAAGPRPARTGG